MSIIWRKLWRDLFRNRMRSVLVILAIATGVFGLGFVFGSSELINSRLMASHHASVPAHITLQTGPFDRETLEIVRKEPGIADADALAAASIRWKAEGETEWREGVVWARADYGDQHIGVFERLEGSWPLERTVAVEKMTGSTYGIDLGDAIVVEFGRGERKLPVVGIARHPEAVSPPLGRPVFFATSETVAWLNNVPEAYSQLLVTMEAPFSEEAAEELGARLDDELQAMDITVWYRYATDPGEHPAQDTLNALNSILVVLGVLSLALSGFLIINIMNATVAQEIWQIGVMKVVGATAGRVMRIYLALVLIYGLLSLVLAIPLGALASHLLAGYLLSLFNVSAGQFGFTPQAVAIQLTVGLAVPVLGALIPVLGAARITPRQAIASYGLGGSFGKGWFDRLIGRVRGLPRPFALSLRNTFRRKTRIALTLTTLVLGGLMFIVVLSVSASMTHTLEVLLADFGFDILMDFGQAYRVQRLVDAAEAVPGIDVAEAWGYSPARIALDGGESFDGFVWAVPPDSVMFNPNIVSGRNLLPEDGRAILLNSKIAADEGFAVGDVITLTINDRELTWTVVGLAMNVNNLQRDSFVTFDGLARATGMAGRAGLMMVTLDEGAGTQAEVAEALRTGLKARHIEVNSVQTADEVRAANAIQFNVVTYLMLAMSALAALVGSIGLMSAMSVNVVERRREIGVMRAIGGTSGVILGIFVVEGLLVGLLSFVVAAAVSYPCAKLFSDLVASMLFRFPLDFDYSLVGTVGWLGIVTVLSALASLVPALKAARISVRETLAYE